MGYEPPCTTFWKTCLCLFNERENDNADADADADADSLVETPSWPPFTPVHTLDPWLGDGLVEYCRTHLVSHITNDGINTREMLAAVSGDLSQMVSVRIWSV